MLLPGFWVRGLWILAALIAPALADPARSGGSPAQLVLGLALVAAALLVVAAVTLPRHTAAGAPGLRAFARRFRTAARPRLMDPDAAGRPRSRAPSRRPAAA
jgi:hypothetical protein